MTEGSIYFTLCSITCWVVPDFNPQFRLSRDPVEKNGAHKHHLLWRGVIHLINTSKLEYAKTQTWMEKVRREKNEACLTLCDYFQSWVMLGSQTCQYFPKCNITSHARWTVSKICWISFKCSSGKEPVGKKKNVWKGDANLKKKEERKKTCRIIGWTFCLSYSTRTNGCDKKVWRWICEISHLKSQRSSCIARLKCVMFTL